MYSAYEMQQALIGRVLEYRLRTPPDAFRPAVLYDPPPSISDEFTSDNYSLWLNCPIREHWELPMAQGTNMHMYDRK